MSLYRLTPEAAEDLESIIGYISLDNPRAAINVLEAITKAFQTLSSTPQMGAKRAHLASRFPEIRVWPIRKYPNYLVFYKPDTKGIQVIRILHGAQKSDDILGMGVH